jgi:hypothetical protein
MPRSAAAVIAWAAQASLIISIIATRAGRGAAEVD